MLEIIKKNLHYDETETLYDAELTQYIDACHADLLRSGVVASAYDETDAAIINVTQAYVEFRTAPTNEIEKRKMIYDSLKTELIVSEDYIVG